MIISTIMKNFSAGVNFSDQQNVFSFKSIQALSIEPNIFVTRAFLHFCQEKLKL